MKYEAEKIQRAKWQSYACIKGLGWNKHNFVYMVYNGSPQSQGVVITSRCSWHERFDRYVTEFHIEITSWKAREYGIFTRVGEVSEIERVSAAIE